MPSSSLRPIVLLALVSAGCGAPDPDAIVERTDFDDAPAVRQGDSLGGCDAFHVSLAAPPAAQTFLSRAYDWVNRGVMYCQCVTGAGGPYRTDCSGFVTYVWGLPSPGYVTSQFATGWRDRGFSHEISWSEVEPGDALNYGDGHIMLFAGWMNDAHTRVCVIEESNYGKPAHFAVHSFSDPASWWNGGGGRFVDIYRPIRLNGYDPRPVCTPHCEGNVAIGRDCSRSDCGAVGTACFDSGGPRCVGVPRGSLDGASCGAIEGWAQDLNDPNGAASVDVFVDTAPGAGPPAVRVRAGERRPDLCGAIGSCDHGFRADTPLALRDGREHRVWAVVKSSVHPSLDRALGGPRAFRCAAPLVGDFNGDGRADLVQYRGDAAGVPVCLSTMDGGWSCRHLAATDAGGSRLVRDGAVPLLGHFNTDSWIDLIEAPGGSASSLPTCLSLASGWSCRDEDAPYAGGPVPAGNGGSGLFTGRTPLAGDFNGDGMTDLIQWGGGDGSLPVCLALGSGWSCRGLRAEYVDGSPGGVAPGARPLVGDFDGDGRDDVVQFRAAGTTIPICLSIGTGWSCRDLRADYAGGDGAGEGGSGVYAGAVPLASDFDHDGHTDLIQYREGAASIAVCRLLGGAWSCRNLHADYAGGEGAGVGGSGVLAGSIPVVADFDGDGRADLAQYRSDRATIGICRSMSGGKDGGGAWSCRNARAIYEGGLGAGNGGAAVYRGGQPLAGDFDGDGHADLAQHLSGWKSIPVCSLRGDDFRCRNEHADYDGGLGAGGEGSGVY